MQNRDVEPGTNLAGRDEKRRSERQGVVLVELARLPERALVDETALAKALGVSKRTVRRMAGRMELPPAVRLAGRSMWQAGRVLAWFEVRAERAARDAERTARRSRQHEFGS